MQVHNQDNFTPQVQHGVAEQERKTHRWHPKRGGSAFFPGLLLIFIGGVFLASNLGYLSDANLSEVFSKIWLVFIIFAGLSLLSAGGWILRTLSVLLMLAVFVFVYCSLLKPEVLKQWKVPKFLQDAGSIYD